MGALIPYEVLFVEHSRGKDKLLGKGVLPVKRMDGRVGVALLVPKRGDSLLHFFPVDNLEDLPPALEWGKQLLDQLTTGGDQKTIKALEGQLKGLSPSWGS